MHETVQLLDYVVTDGYAGLHKAWLLGTGLVHTGWLLGTRLVAAGALDWAAQRRLCKVAKHWTSGCGCTGLVCTGLCRATSVLGYTWAGAGAGATGLVTGVVVAQGQGLMDKGTWMAAEWWGCRGAGADGSVLGCCWVAAGGYWVRVRLL
ncbi:hypothetical protein Acr_18g0007220 [Actinidia rufa]|uniref:Uncharacterized protein n=1 Tax=Actinidia rufa TaxID=165716 RepID=A0A7J0G757_9ERIC|nr:hypothetical protein Acr_18g0007220 [Actinidia rufa]